MAHTHTPEYRVLFAADIQSSAGRGNLAQQTIRAALFTATRDAMDAAGVQLDDCHFEDTGDGLRIALPGGVPKAVMIHPFALELALRLMRYNELAAPKARIALRCALHAGDIFVTDGRLEGGSLEFLARLLEAEPSRAALVEAADSAPVVLAISQHVYDEAVGHGYLGIDPHAFLNSSFQVKETSATAWFTLPGVGAPFQAAEKKARARVRDSAADAANPHGQTVVTPRGDIYKSPIHTGVGDQNVTY